MGFLTYRTTTHIHVRVHTHTHNICIDISYTATLKHQCCYVKTPITMVMTNLWGNTAATGLGVEGVTVGLVCAVTVEVVKADTVGVVCVVVVINVVDDAFIVSLAAADL